MVSTFGIRLTRALLLLGVVNVVHSHGHGSPVGQDTDAAASAQSHLANTTSPLNMTIHALPQSYFASPSNSGFMLAHIALMGVGWFFILPIGMHRTAKCSQIS